MSSHISEQILNTNLFLSPSDLSAEIDKTIYEKLKKQLEGLCFEDGYIIKDSITIIKRSIGGIQTRNNQSQVKYIVNYKASVISPNNGDTIETYVNNINKMGVVSYIKLKDEDTSENSPMIVIIPKEYFEKSIVNISDINVGQKLTVKIMDSRVKYNSDKIQAIGSPL
jgi:DNA-directed RNA polymerase subunit E'/Rpb7